MEDQGESPSGPVLKVVATPIGNLSDLSPRAIAALTEAEFWIVEDTRVSGKLASHLGLKKPMKILNDHSSPEVAKRILNDVRSATAAALLTDGGTPVISDPGTGIVELCHEANVRVEGIPGPSAPILALSVSGFYAQRFAFLGFLGRKPGDIRKELGAFTESPLTLVLFESHHRIESLLENAATALGERRYVVCREMTKTFEQLYRGRLPYIPTAQELPRKGELTIVLEGLRRKMPT